MKLIGISGKSGSGKTTVSEMLAKKLNCEVYHLDELNNEVQEWKKKVFLKRITIISSSESQGEDKAIINPNLKGKGKVISSKNIEKLYEQIKMLALKSIIRKKIANQSVKRAKYFIIEGTQLSVYVPLGSLDARVLIERPYELRERDVTLRDGISKQEFKEREEYDEIKIDLCKSFEYRITNGDSKEELEEQVRGIVDKIEQMNKMEIIH